jgi:soluble lytic murein transglycosylase
MQVKTGAAIDVGRRQRRDLCRVRPDQAFGQHGDRPVLSRAAARPALHRRPAAQGDRRLQCRADAGRLWNSDVRDGGDPLLYIESIPYWETRGYVMTVLRNYWMYENQEGRKSASREALTQGLWPKFPGLPGRRQSRSARATPRPRQRTGCRWQLTRASRSARSGSRCSRFPTRGPWRTTVRATGWSSG